MSLTPDEIMAAKLLQAAIDKKDQIATVIKAEKEETDALRIVLEESREILGEYDSADTVPRVNMESLRQAVHKASQKGRKLRDLLK